MAVIHGGNPILITEPSLGDPILQSGRLLITILHDTSFSPNKNTQAVAVHGTSYVNVIGNVAFDIVGHMCETPGRRCGCFHRGGLAWCWDVFVLLSDYDDDDDDDDECSFLSCTIIIPRLVASI